ncbi:MAG: PGF-CTERM sorting domain-containing protein [Methanosarcinales archaeon]|nr:PGF-CTERM sorting domain-containing protein [Methanosarcinales archaeon]
MKQSQNKSRIISVVITMLVILMLIISEPAGAVTVKVDTTNMPTTVGDTGYFYFNVTIGGNEKIPIADFTIEGLPHIDGSSNGTLVFKASDIGTAVNSEKPVGDYKIKLVKTHGWVGSEDDSFGNLTNRNDAPFDGYGFGYSFVGYGYGYGYGNTKPNVNQYTKLSYKITIDSTDATAGTYDVTGKINTGCNNDKSFSSSSTSFELSEKESSRRRSSSGGSSNYWKYHGTPTPTSTESIDATEDQTQPAQTQTEQVASTPTPVTTEEPTDDGGIPGFGAVTFIAGILAAAYIIMRKRG